MFWMTNLKRYSTLFQVLDLKCTQDNVKLNVQVSEGMVQQHEMVC